jgi:hypothetical protein
VLRWKGLFFFFWQSRAGQSRAGTVVETGVGRKGAVSSQAALMVS